MPSKSDGPAKAGSSSGAGAVHIADTKEETTVTMPTDAPAADGDGTSPSKPAAERQPTFADYIRVFSYATKWDMYVYVIAALASIGAGVTLPLMNVIFGQLVGQFSEYFGSGSSASSAASLMPREEFESILSRQALYIFALFVGRWGLNAINKFCFRMIGIRLSSAVRLHYLRSLFAQSIHVIDSMPAGAPATAITSTSNTLQLGISERLGTFLEFNGTIWAAIVVSFVWSWELTLVTSSLILYTVVVLVVVLPLTLKHQTAMLKADGQGNAVASEALGAIRLVMASGAQSQVITSYNRWVSESKKHGHRMGPVAGLQLGLIFFGVFGAFGLAFWYGAQRYMAGAVANAGVIVIVLMSVMMVLTSLERISTPLIAVSKAMVAACEFFTVIDAPLPDTGSLKPESAAEDIVFRDVHFAYPSRPSVKVLDGMNLRIQSGVNTALVGSSGSGKSTIVGLVLRWYSLQHQHVMPRVIKEKKAEAADSEKGVQDEPEAAEVKPVEISGSITLGDHNLEGLELTWWRTQIGLVQQEPFLFNDTIFNNVARGLIGTKWEDETEERKRELVKEACHEAYADEFIDRLPDGYNTKVGDGGAKLSGGQKQRIAIARSIIKKPQIIILDEATSAIDVRSEKIVQAALDKITKGRTTITIAHRLSTVKKADNIIVLQNGRAVEQGTHQSLVANPAGIYAGLVRAQALRLAPEDASDAEAPAKLAAGIAGSETTLDSDHQVVVAASPVPTVSGDGDEMSKASLANFLTLLYRQRKQFPYYVGIILAAMSVATGTPLQAWLFAKVLGVFLLPGGDLDSQADFWGLMWLALAGGVGLGYFFTGWIGLRAQYFVSAAYKLVYLTDVLYQKLSFFDQDENSHGSLSSRIASDAKQLEELMGVNLAFFLSGMFTVVGCLTISLAFGWKLALVGTFVTMPIMLASGYWKLRHEYQFDQMNTAVFMESSQFATEAIGAIRTVSALTMETKINDRYKQLLDGHVHDAYRKARITALLFGFADSVSLGCQALVFYYGGKLLANGEYGFEAFFVCFMALIQGAEAASQSLAVAPSAAQAIAAANRILTVQKTADVEGRSAVTGGEIAGTEGGIQIELRDVSFRYPTRDVPVFQSLNLTVEKGQYAALVGPSGCGKSTIISLLERFYDVEDGQGAILCNDTNINSLNAYAYRRHLSLVAQEPTMFKGTIRDNVLFGVKDPESVTDARLHEVCRDAFIHDFIISLPEGYGTDIGQKGVSMSGGQKQRLAIARALIRDPKILLLDEATSALDSESEKSVQAAFERAREGRTMVVVAHRLSTIQNADVIFVLDAGKVVEKGTHAELLRQRGVYWSMCQNQALDQ